MELFPIAWVWKFLVLSSKIQMSFQMTFGSLDKFYIIISIFIKKNWNFFWKCGHVLDLWEMISSSMELQEKKIYFPKNKSISTTRDVIRLIFID